MEKTTLNFNNVKFNELTEDNQFSITGGGIKEIGEILVELVEVIIEEITEVPSFHPVLK